MVGNQWIGRKGQYLVEDEQGEHVAGKRHAQGARDGHREENVEPGLVRFAMPAHVPDGVQRRHDPEPRGDQTEEHAQGLNFKCQCQARQHLENLYARPRSGDDFRNQGENHEKQHATGCQRGRLTEIGPPSEKTDHRGPEKGQQNGNQRGVGSGHGATPRSQPAARRETPTVKDVETPKYRVAAIRIHIGRCISSGASLTPEGSAGLRK